MNNYIITYKHKFYPSTFINLRNSYSVRFVIVFKYQNAVILSKKKIFKDKTKSIKIKSLKNKNASTMLQ